jgi:pyridoxal phosphate enzyme (YggS family)
VNDIDPITPAMVRDNLAAIEARIAAACRDVGRDPASVRLLPVTKTVSVEGIRAACEAGYRWFGENKVQEAQSKAALMADLPVDWCIIGHLQTNKARHVAGFAAELHSLDSIRLAEELDRRLQAQGRAMRVLVQVNTSGEPGKSGLAPQDVQAFVRQMPAFSSLQVTGFMTLAMQSDDVQAVRSCFRLLRTVRDEAREWSAQGLAFDELSMGMSGDFEWAIAEGSTIVRVGQAIFGARPPNRA